MPDFEFLIPALDDHRALGEEARDERRLAMQVAFRRELEEAARAVAEGDPRMGFAARGATQASRHHAGVHTRGQRLLSTRAVAADRGHDRRLITTSGPLPWRADRGQRVA